MKNHSNFLRLFMKGVFLAFIMSIMTYCPEPNPTEPVVKPVTETEPMKKVNQSAVDAFRSGDKQKVIDLMYEEYKDIYGKQLDGVTTEKMNTFATAMEKRKLLIANELYAEYELTIDGITFTIAYSNSGDGIWKLNRF